MKFAELARGLSKLPDGVIDDLLTAGIAIVKDGERVAPADFYIDAPIGREEVELRGLAAGVELSDFADHPPITRAETIRRGVDYTKKRSSPCP